MDTGAAWLASKQGPNGSFGGVARGQIHYEIGTTALAGLALLAAGAKKGDAIVDRALAFVKEKDAINGPSGSRTTYDTGILLMFLTDYYRGQEEAQPHGTTRPGRGAGGRATSPTTP